MQEEREARTTTVSDERDPVRRTYTSAGTAGDTSQQSHYGQYELINGNAPVYSFQGPPGTRQSELFKIRSLTVGVNDVALPAEKGNLELAGLALVYEGNRVKSALLGRDLNPMGRGDGVHYFAGAMTLAAGTRAMNVWGKIVGTGNSVNNPSQTGGGYTPIGPPSDGSSSSPYLELTSDWIKRTGKQPANPPANPPGIGKDHFFLEPACYVCPTLSACCMTVDSATGETLPYPRSVCLKPGEHWGSRDPAAECGDPGNCGQNAGGGGGGGGSTGGGGCSGCGGGAGGGPMSFQGGGGGGPMSFADKSGLSAVPYPGDRHRCPDRCDQCLKDRLPFDTKEGINDWKWQAWAIIICLWLLGGNPVLSELCLELFGGKDWYEVKQRADWGLKVLCAYYDCAVLECGRREPGDHDGCDWLCSRFLFFSGAAKDLCARHNL